MTQTLINFAKWFARQRIVAQFTLVIVTMGGIITFVVCLLIWNYKDQRIEDAGTIKDLRLQLVVKDAYYQANERRKDSIHQIEINNKNLALKAFTDQMIKDQENLMKMFIERNSELKHR